MSDPYPEVFSALEWKRHTERAEADAKKFLARAERWEQLARQLAGALYDANGYDNVWFPETETCVTDALAAYREAVDEEGT